MINTQIRILRIKKGWSQAELAHRLHISPSTVGMYEQGRREPSIETLVELSKAFDVTLDYLILGNCSANLSPHVNKYQQRFHDLLPEIRNLSHDELIYFLIANVFMNKND